MLYWQRPKIITSIKSSSTSGPFMLWILNWTSTEVCEWWLGLPWVQGLDNTVLWLLHSSAHCSNPYSECYKSVLGPNGRRARGPSMLHLTLWLLLDSGLVLFSCICKVETEQQVCLPVPSFLLLGEYVVSRTSICWCSAFLEILRSSHLSNRPQHSTLIFFFHLLWWSATPW